MTHNTHKSSISLWLTILTVMALAVTVSAGTYVSPRGKFQISYPASWKQIDYGTLDGFLELHNAGESVLDYDAGFTDSTVIPFFVGTYMILTVDTTGPATSKQIDSVLEGLHKAFGENIQYFPVADMDAHQKTNSPTYDSVQKVVTVISDVVEDDQIIKKHAFLIKFYEHGTANFFFYTPDSLFEKTLPLFQQIVGSLSTENLEAATPKEEVKVADLENREIPTDDSSKSKIRTSLPYFSGGLFAVLIIVIIKMRRKRTEKTRK